jgi:hypothetical protein
MCRNFAARNNKTALLWHIIMNIIIVKVARMSIITKSLASSIS